MGGSVKKTIQSAVMATSNVLDKTVGVKLVEYNQPQPSQQQAAEGVPETPQGTAQTVVAAGGAQQAQVAGASEEAEVSRGSGARNTDPRRARAKFRVPTVSVGGTGAQAKPGISIGI